MTGQVADMASEDAVRHAWIDESIHATASVPMYVLAAVVADPTTCDPVREELRSLVRRPRQRIHWRAEEAADRLRAVRVLAASGTEQVVIVGSPLDPRRQERARRKCMERLFFEFGNLVLSTVWIESRTPSLNRADQQMLLALRGSGVMPKGLRCEFALPSTDPMLWAADVVAGAVAASFKGEAAYGRVLYSGLTVHELDLGR